MATISGVILDVSGSMKRNIGDCVDEEEGPWARSIFKVIDDLIKHDLSSENKVFAVGVGAKYATGIIDVISTIKKASAEHVLDDTMPATDNTIESILQILEKNGASTVRMWAEKETISRGMSEKRAARILKQLTKDKLSVEVVVNECLPRICRDWIRPLTLDVMHAVSIVPNHSNVLKTAQNATALLVSSFRKATVEDVKDAVAKAERSLGLRSTSISSSFVGLSTESVFSVQEAHTILHGVVDERDLAPARSRDLLKKLKPYIYGKTPLRASINEATDLLLMTLFTDHLCPRLLFIVSDGKPTDKSIEIKSARYRLTRDNAKVVCCYISNTYTIEPRRLYSSSQYGWEKGAKFLFDLSSTVPTEFVTRAIFIKRGWQIDIDNNETRLFLHVNHPDNLKDACDLARNVVCCQDALSELLVSVDLDIYINQKNASIQAYEQEGGTCYANASAAVLHLAMHRILGRHKLSFEALRDEMISLYGTKGANTLLVLQQICPKYHLRCKEVDVQGAMKAISEKRPVVARFRLTDTEWKTFETFFKTDSPTRCEILTKRQLDISKRQLFSSTSGHAVVLTSYNSKCLRLMNSWGQTWGDNGFFKVETAEVLGLEFFDVYWVECDLTPEDRSSYQAHGAEVARKLMSLLKCLQVAMFTCPSCRQSSLVTEFRGSLSHAICPRCSHVFSSNDGNGNILALNVHLTSLSST